MSRLRIFSPLLLSARLKFAFPANPLLCLCKVHSNIAYKILMIALVTKERPIFTYVLVPYIRTILRHLSNEIKKKVMQRYHPCSYQHNRNNLSSQCPGIVKRKLDSNKPLF